MGLPFLPTLTMLGLGPHERGRIEDDGVPLHRRDAPRRPALFPDVALLHVQRADRFGNCQIDGYPHMDADIASAAATVLVTAEEIVSEDEIRATRPHRHPRFAVDALAHVPTGSYPHECYGLYDSEPGHFGEYVDGDPGARAPRGVDGISSATCTRRRHADYLALFGRRCAADAARGREPARDRGVGTAPSPRTSCLAVMGSRELRDHNPSSPAWARP
jgi:glutaconate CoA-transferase subunit A